MSKGAAGARITRVEPISLFVPLREPIDAPIAIPHAGALADIVFRGYRATLVRIEIGHARNLEFEKAAKLRDQLAELKKRLFGVALQSQ